MIDYLMSFRDEAAAKADPGVGRYFTPGVAPNPGSWQLDKVNPTIFFYDKRDDTIETIQGPDGPIDIVVHHPYDTQWRAIISTLNHDPALDASKGMECICERGTSTIIESSFQLQAFEFLRYQPIFCGMEGYPFAQP
jgi:hypothetical protein